MIWQDYVIMTCLAGFAVALVPSIVGKNKPAKVTCLMTVLLGTIIAVCFGTLGLWLSMTVESLMIAAWFVLLVQKRG